MSKPLSKLGALHLTEHTGAKHTATVIFFHGSGSLGTDVKEWVRLLVKKFSFPQIKILYPTAPLQPYTPAGGEMSHVWFDRIEISPHVPEIMPSLSSIEKEIKRLIQNENEAGIPSSRIIVGGFSMGGCLALHTAYRWDPQLAGVFAFSSFLNDNSSVYSALKKLNKEKVPPLLQIQGDADDLVLPQWSEETFNKLKELGVDGEFHFMQREGHCLTKQGMKMIKAWIEKRLPQL